MCVGGWDGDHKATLTPLFFFLVSGDDDMARSAITAVRASRPRYGGGAQRLPSHPR